MRSRTSMRRSARIISRAGGAAPRARRRGARAAARGRAARRAATPRRAHPPTPRATGPRAPRRPRRAASSRAIRASAWCVCSGAKLNARMIGASVSPCTTSVITITHIVITMISLRYGKGAPAGDRDAAARAPSPATRCRACSSTRRGRPPSASAAIRCGARARLSTTRQLRARSAPRRAARRSRPTPITTPSRTSDPASCPRQRRQQRPRTARRAAGRSPR